MGGSLLLCLQNNPGVKGMNDTGEREGITEDVASLKRQLEWDPGQSGETREPSTKQNQRL